MQHFSAGSGSVFELSGHIRMTDSEPALQKKKSAENYFLLILKWFIASF